MRPNSAKITSMSHHVWVLLGRLSLPGCLGPSCFCMANFQYARLSIGRDGSG
jgi:hypothetical protein